MNTFIPESSSDPRPSGRACVERLKVAVAAALVVAYGQEMPANEYPSALET